MPAYDVRAAYSILIAATPQRVWEELLNADFHSMPITRRLMRLRSLGHRKPTAGRPSTLATMGSGGAGGFLEISRVPEQEIVLAIVGRFWLPHAPVLRDWKAEEFPGACAAWRRQGGMEFLSDGGRNKASGIETRLSTETRVLCFGRAARIAIPPVLVSHRILLGMDSQRDAGDGEAELRRHGRVIAALCTATSRDFCRYACHHLSS